jgi:hypothetical protein
VDEIEQLAELSHTIDRVALALCQEDPDDRRVELYVVEMADGQREAVAIALSYALRRRDLEGATPLNERAVAALAGAMRRMSLPEGTDPDDDLI